jgi:hypothetical protein
MSQLRKYDNSPSARCSIAHLRSQYMSQHLLGCMYPQDKSNIRQSLTTHTCQLHSQHKWLMMGCSTSQHRKSGKLSLGSRIVPWRMLCTRLSLQWIRCLARTVHKH